MSGFFFLRPIMTPGTIDTDVGTLHLKFNGFWNSERDRFIDFPNDVFFMFVEKNGYVSLSNHPPMPAMESGFWNFGYHAPYNAWRSDVIAYVEDQDFNGYDRETDDSYIADWYHRLYLVTGRQLLEFEKDAYP